MKVVLSIFLLFTSVFCQAQGIEMADEMRSNGKIYVVVTVLATILIGLIVYLISIDKKIGKLEKSVNEGNSDS